MKVTLIVDYFETFQGDLKTKKTKNVEQLKSEKLYHTTNVTGNVIGQRKEIVKTKENLSQPGRSIENDAKLHHPIARQRGDLRNAAGRTHEGESRPKQSLTLVTKNP